MGSLAPYLHDFRFIKSDYGPILTPIITLLSITILIECHREHDLGTQLLNQEPAIK